MTTATDARLQISQFAPGLTVNDLARSTAFYQALGFVVTERWEQEGQLRGVMLGAGQGMLGLSQDDWKKGKDRVKGVGFRFWVSTDQDVDELAAQAVAGGLTLTKAPYDTPWGHRAFEVTDPDGFQITISRATEAKS